jgi:hypothetical protein
MRGTPVCLCNPSPPKMDLGQLVRETRWVTRTGIYTMHQRADVTLVRPRCPQMIWAPLSDSSFLPEQTRALRNQMRLKDVLRTVQIARMSYIQNR